MSFKLLVNEKTNSEYNNMANLPYEQRSFDNFGATFCNVSKLRHVDLRSQKLSVTYRTGSVPHFGSV